MYKRQLLYRSCLYLSVVSAALRPMRQKNSPQRSSNAPRPLLPLIIIISISSFARFVNRLFPFGKNIFSFTPSLPLSYAIFSKIFQKIFQNPLEKYGKMYYNGCSYHFLITKIKIQIRGTLYMSIIGESIRNIAVIGHSGEGKTLSLIHIWKRVRPSGSVSDGTTRRKKFCAERG